MLRDVTLGQYYSCDSFIHSLDPRTKIRFIIAYIILLIIDRNLVLFGVLTIVFGVCVWLSRIPIGYMFKGTKGIIAAIMICSAINIFTTPGDVLINVGSAVLTIDGFVKFGFITWRMLLMIFMSSLLMYTTTPTEFTDGLEKCFKLSGNVAMEITIAMRFISVLFEELNRIMTAQEARGANFRSGSLINRLKAVSKLLVPLFQNAIDRASNLGEAMDARCYTGGKNRTKLRPLRYDRKDVVVYIIMVGLIAVSVWLAVRF